jgi:predicted DNA-binding transcriptional regulator YafY
VPKRSNQKLKLLYIYKILLEQTDALNGLTLTQLAEELLKYDIRAERKTLYDDIEALKLFGVDIAIKRDRHVRYYVATREIPLECLKLMADLINSSPLLAQKKREQILRRLVRLGGKSSAQILRSLDSDADERETVTVDGIAAVCRAITENKRIKCRCFTYNSQKQRIMQFNGATLTLSPWYLELVPLPRFVAYDHSTRQMLVLCADRLLNAELISVSREGEREYVELCASGGIDTMLGHLRPTMIRLRCANSVADQVIRKFGLGITVLGNTDDSFDASIKVAPDRQFYSWIFAMEGKVEILSPESAVVEYKKMVDSSFNE